MAKRAFYEFQDDIVRTITKSLLQSNIEMVAKIAEEYGLDFDALIRKYGLATASVDMATTGMKTVHQTCMALTSKKKTRCKRPPAEHGGGMCTYHSKRV